MLVTVVQVVPNPGKQLISLRFRGQCWPAFISNLPKESNCFLQIVENFQRIDLIQESTDSRLVKLWFITVFIPSLRLCASGGIEFKFHHDNYYCKI